MNKKEKYINYVVNDLVSKTEIDYDQEKIKFPFYNNSIFFISLPSSPFSFFPFRFSRFSKHVIERYGAHSEEIKIIWYQYKERIQPLIK